QDLNTGSDDRCESRRRDIGECRHGQGLRRVWQYKDSTAIGMAADPEAARPVTLDDLPIFCDERRDVQAYDFPLAVTVSRVAGGLALPPLALVPSPPEPRFGRM